jgi:mannose-6-phosphate isomerase-like protein (cupin superfamily)
MKTNLCVVCALIIAASGSARSQNVDVYTANDLQAMGHGLARDGKSFASKELVRYSNHYTMFAMRETTGSSELHEHEADVFVVESGKATIVTGGKMVNPQTQKAGEIRGTSITGGERHVLQAGDIIHIPAGVPHQLLIEKAPFDYFVIKVTGQDEH